MRGSDVRRLQRQKNGNNIFTTEDAECTEKIEDEMRD
jgi:hypothetical protein